MIILSFKVTWYILGQESFLGFRINSTLIKSHLENEKEKPAVKHLRIFLLETLRNCIINDKFNPQMTTIRAFFPKIRALFSIFQKGHSRPPPLVTRLRFHASQIILTAKLYDIFQQFTMFPIQKQLFACHFYHYESNTTRVFQIDEINLPGSM